MNIENPLLRRACLYLEDGEWGKADDYCEKVLDQEPENAQAYVIKLMIRLKVDKVEKLGEVSCDYEQWNSYCKAYRFADGELKTQLGTYLRSVQEKIREEERQREAEQEAQRNREREQLRAMKYAEGLRLSRENASASELKKAEQRFLEIQDYKDAKEKAEACKQRMEALEKEIQAKKVLEWEQERKADKKKRRKTLLIVAAVLIGLVMLSIWAVRSQKSVNAEKAEQIKTHLVNATFTGSELGSVSSQPMAASAALVKEMTVNSYEITFHSGGTATITRTERYDKEPFITKNGERQWDSEREYVRTVTWKDVNVSVTGRITVQIDGVRCVVKVNGNNVPISFVMDGVTYTK